MDKDNDNLHRNDYLRAEALLADFADVFSTGDDDQGKTGLVTHRIDTQDFTPIRQIPRRLPLAKQAVVNEITTMQKQGVIEPSTSPWTSPVVLVKKKDVVPDSACITEN